MRAPARLAIYGAGLAVAFGGAFGIARVAVPDSVVGAWEEDSQVNEHDGKQDDMRAHDDPADAGEHGSDADAGGHDHAPDGGPPPEGIEAASSPAYPVGTKVLLTADHMPGMQGAEATISGAFDTTTYSVSYTPTTGGDPVTDHRWVVQEELESPGGAPLPDGTAVTLLADHMAGMAGARAKIDGSTDETVYMVDLDAGGMEMTRHKWVVESEIRPLE